MCPIYEYKCLKCTAKKELLRKISDRDKLIKCRKCKTPMIRAITAANFRLLGEGFYKPSIEEVDNE